MKTILCYLNTRFWSCFCLILLVLGQGKVQAFSAEYLYYSPDAPLYSFSSDEEVARIPASFSPDEFTETYFQASYPVLPLTNQYREEAKAFIEKLEHDNRYVEYLTPEDLNVLPVGLKKTVNNTSVKIAISHVAFMPSHAELTVFARVEIPQAPYQLFFGAKGIKLSYDGGIIGDASLVLLGDLPIRINNGNAALILKGGMDMGSGKAQDLTYLSIDCDGFKELGLAAVVEFPNSLLIPVNAKGEPIPNEKVRSAFQTVVRDWNDILASISLPDFEINGLKGYTFHVTRAVFDLSDHRNSNDIVYPQGYAEKYLDNVSPNLWRGVYLHHLDVQLPPQFSSTKKNNGRVSFQASHLLLDDNGLTGLLSAQNLLPLSEGTASGWAFSVNYFELGLEANQLVSAGFEGAIALPVASQSPLGYTALISRDNDYVLQVNPLDELQFDLWQAQAKLFSDSFLELKVVDGAFKPKATLHGEMSIAASNKPGSANTLAQFKGVEFKGLHIQTDAPHLSADYFGYRGEVRVANFPVSLDNIALRTRSDEVSLDFDLKVNLMEKQFAGSTRLHLVSQLEQKNGETQRWKYKKVELAAINLKADIGALALDGKLNLLQDDPIYGNGFAGEIRANFKALELDVQARAMFGRTEFSYWFVDARVAFPGGMPVVPPVNLTGFGGGASYRMKRDGNSLLASPTGAIYRPDASTGLGIKAAVLFNVGEASVMNGEASFEAAFNQNGGINYLGLFGYTKFMANLPGVSNLDQHLGQKFAAIQEKTDAYVKGNPALGDRLESMKIYNPQQAAAIITPVNETPGQAGVSAYLGMQMDFTRKSFHANMDLYVNAAAGLIRGTASGNRAGWAVMHIAPEEWYLHMGTPEDRLGLQFSVGKVGVKTGSYFMAGDRIPASPAPPRQVADILGVELASLDYMRNENALGEGKGLAFGSSLQVETGDMSFLMLYSNFDAGLGFDMMMKNYEGAYCQGSMNPIGLNGWYANGQAYVYLQGELGVKVNLRFVKARVPVIKGGTAALLQAKLPNPAWFTGHLGVRFNVMGGLVKGNVRYKLTIGEECTIVGGGMESPLGVQIIADMTPRDRAETDVFAAPQVAFNMRVNVPVEIEDEKGRSTYRIKLDEFKLTHKGQAIAGTLEWNGNKDAVTFISSEILPPSSEVKAFARVSFEELKNGNWQAVYVDGKKSTEEREVTFTTGTAPANIPLHNIAYAYPVVEQKNLYRNEHPNGYVKLKRGQAYLFEGGRELELQVLQNGQPVAQQRFSYDKHQNQLNYSLPILSATAGYSFDWVAMAPATASAAGQENYRQVLSEGENTVSVRENKAAEAVREGGAHSLLTYTFHTSSYNTFADKVTAVSKGSRTIWGRIASDVIKMELEIKPSEPFDLTELTGMATSDFKPLVQPVATLDDAYFTYDIYPNLYKNYPLAEGLHLTHRDTAAYGLKPARALPVLHSYLMDAEAGATRLQTRLPYVYNLPHVYKLDYLDLQNQIVNKFLGLPGLSQYSYFITGRYEFIRYGTYRVRYQYVLPGGQKGSSAIVEYANPIKL